MRDYQTICIPYDYTEEILLDINEIPAMEELPKIMTEIINRSYQNTLEKTSSACFNKQLHTNRVKPIYNTCECGTDFPTYESECPKCRKPLRGDV